MTNDTEKIVLDLRDDPAPTVRITTETKLIAPVHEELTGEIDGENKIFATTLNYKIGSTEVFINGLKQKLGTHYTESGDKEITFIDANEFEDELLINYITR